MLEAVKTLTLSNALTLQVVSGVPAHGHQTDDIDVSDFSNAQRLEKVPRAQIEETEISLQCYYDGTLATVGSKGTLVIAVTKDDGSTLSASVVGYIKSAIPTSVDIGGERRLMQDIVFMPDGSNNTSTTTTT